MAIAKVKEYYPSLMTSEYKVGEYYLFVRHNTYTGYKISEDKKLFMEKTEVGGLMPDEERAGLIPDNGADLMVGGLEPDNGEEEVKIGGLIPDNEISKLSNADFSKYSINESEHGDWKYEVGRVIGVNESDAKIYVQFAETKEGYCHVYKTEYSSELFDLREKFLTRK